MQSLLVTNNEEVLAMECLKQQDAPMVLEIDGHAVDVLRATRDILLQGWRLSADPLAGHFIRLNPYHTILLEKGEDRQCRCYDLARIERALAQWDRSGEPVLVRGSYKSDYQMIDRSLATCMLDEK